VISAEPLQHRPQCRDGKVAYYVIVRDHASS